MEKKSTRIAYFAALGVFVVFCVPGSHCPPLAVTEWRVLLVSFFAFTLYILNAFVRIKYVPILQPPRRFVNSVMYQDLHAIRRAHRSLSRNCVRSKTFSCILRCGVLR